MFGIKIDRLNFAAPRVNSPGAGQDCPGFALLSDRCSADTAPWACGCSIRKFLTPLLKKQEQQHLGLDAQPEKEANDTAARRQNILFVPELLV